MERNVDLKEIIERIRMEWEGLKLKCDCGPNAACSICEIQSLLEMVIDDEQSN